MHVAFVQNTLPPIIRAGALMVMIGGLSGCGRVGDVAPVAANGQKADSATQRQIQNRVNQANSRYSIGGVKEATPALDVMERTLSPELMD